MPLLNESGDTVYGGGTLVYSDKSKTLRLLYTIDTSSHCLPPRTPHPGPQRVLQAEPSDVYCSPPTLSLGETRLWPLAGA